MVMVTAIYFSEPAQGDVLQVEIDGEKVERENDIVEESSNDTKRTKPKAGGKKKKDKSKDGEYGV
jgi:stringent starvation protein B